MRRVEAQDAARLLGAEYAWGGFHDLGIFIDDTGRRRVTALLRRYRPDLVLTASPLDYHCDHEAASRLVQDACFAVSCPNYDTSAFDPAPAAERIPHLYFMDPTEGIDRDQRPIRPHFLVDAAAQLPLKRDALARHASQREWLRRQHGFDNLPRDDGTMDAGARRAGGHRSRRRVPAIYGPPVPAHAAAAGAAARPGARSG